MKKTVIIIILILLIFFSRFAFLDLRVLHHDEGVNYFFASQIFDNGFYSYNPFNYHGPLYFYLIALSFLVFGISEFSLRLPTVIFGILIALFPLIFRIGVRKERIITSVFLFLSPSLMYYSRYSIHEVVFVFFSLLSVYSFSLILERKDLEHLWVFAIALAGMFVLKETAIIMLFVLFVICVVNWKRIRRIKFKGYRTEIIVTLIIFVLIYIMFFTSFFTNIEGLRDSFKAFMPWIDRGLHEIGHDKPFYYYLYLILKYEWPILLFALIGLFNFRKFKHEIIYINIVIWFILIFSVYSFISYKTPWLVINITIPMCFLAGFGFNSLKRKSKWILFAIGILYLAFFSIYLNFVHSWQSDNRFAYVHTDKNILNLVDKINEVYIEGDKILIVSNESEYWPLPFYLRGKETEYLNNIGDEIENYDIFVIRDNLFKIEDWQGHYYREYRLRERVRFYLVWKK